jgi:hypothetical protein
MVWAGNGYRVEPKRNLQRTNRIAGLVVQAECRLADTFTLRTCGQVWKTTLATTRDLRRDAWTPSNARGFARSPRKTAQLRLCCVNCLRLGPAGWLGDLLCKKELVARMCAASH